MFMLWQYRHYKKYVLVVSSSSTYIIYNPPLYTPPPLFHHPPSEKAPTPVELGSPLNRNFATSPFLPP